MKLYATRLKEGEDLKDSIAKFVAHKNLSSAVILSAVGSLSAAKIRMAGAQPNKQDIRAYKGTFEIVSLIGTVSEGGVSHLHIAIADNQGHVFGGHLKEGCIVHTTVELAIGSEPDVLFTRALDSTTGFDELKVAS